MNYSSQSVWHPHHTQPLPKAVEWNCASLLACEIMLSPAGTLDFVSRVATYVFKRVAHEHGPAFWLASNLQSALMQTDLPEHVTGMKRVIPCGMLFLPSNSELISPDKEPVQVIFFSHLLKGEKPSCTLAGTKLTMDMDGDHVQWSTVMASGIAYAGNLGVDRDEGLKLGNNNYSGMTVAKVNASEEDKFINQVSNLILQVLLILQTRPDLFEEVTPMGFGGIKKQGSIKDQETLLRPRWIGKTYRVGRESSAPAVGTHRSPRTHWRRGHYKRVLIGERSLGERKWVWIEPVLVNS